MSHQHMKRQDPLQSSDELPESRDYGTINKAEPNPAVEGDNQESATTHVSSCEQVEVGFDVENLPGYSHAAEDTQVIPQDGTDSVGQGAQYCQVCGGRGDKFTYCQAAHVTCKSCLTEEITRVLTEHKPVLTCQVERCSKDLLLDSRTVLRKMSSLTLTAASNCRSEVATSLIRCPQCHGEPEFDQTTQLYKCPNSLCRMVTFKLWRPAIPTGQTHESDTLASGTDEQEWGPACLKDLHVFPNLPKGKSDDEVVERGKQKEKQKVDPGSSPLEGGQAASASTRIGPRTAIPLYPPRQTAATGSSPLPLLSSADPANSRGFPASRTEVSAKVDPGSSPLVGGQTSSGSTTTGPRATPPQHTPRQTAATGRSLPLLSSANPANPSGFPACWTGISADVPFLASPIGLQSVEAVRVMEMFRSDSLLVTRVVRIQNKSLWERYYLAKQELALRIGVDKIKELYVYKVVEKEQLFDLAEFGFRKRIPDLKFFFSPDDLDSRGKPTVVTQCLAGLWAKGDLDAKQPPRCHWGGRYNSVVNDYHSPSQIRIFDPFQVYPAYLVY